MNENIDLNKNIEIEQALKEFEVKNIEEAPKVASTVKGDESSKMVSFIMKHSGGLIKEERQAEYVLLGIAFLAIAISLYLFFGNNKQNNLPVEPLPDQSQFTQ